MMLESPISKSSTVFR